MSEKTGWVRLHRSLVDHPLITQLPDAWLKVFIVILLKVNWKPAKWWNGSREIEVAAGSMITSVDKLAQISGASRKQVRGCLEYLKAANIAAIETTNKFTTLTILNWDTYQSLDAIEGKQDGNEDGKPGANEGQTRGNNIRIKELRNKEYKSNSGELDAVQPSRGKPAGIDPDIRSWFDTDFWPIYPRHEARGSALSAAAKKATTTEKRSQYLDRLTAQLPEYTRRKAESGQRVIPLAATWFNQDRDQDVLTLTLTSTRGRSQPDADYPEYKVLAE